MKNHRPSIHRSFNWPLDPILSLKNNRGYPVDAGRKLSLYKTFRRRPGRLLNVLCTFTLRPVSTGYHTETSPLICRALNALTHFITLAPFYTPFASISISKEKLALTNIKIFHENWPGGVLFFSKNKQLCQKRDFSKIFLSTSSNFTKQPFLRTANLFGP